jgi:hypothetical protein
MQRAAVVSVAQSRPRRNPSWLGAQLSPCEATTGHGVLGDDGSRSLLIRHLEDADAGVDRPKGRAGQDQHLIVQQTPEPLGVGGERRPFLVGHDGREVVPRRMQELDPLGHALRIDAARSWSTHDRFS